MPPPINLHPPLAPPPAPAPAPGPAQAPAPAPAPASAQAQAPHPSPANSQPTKKPSLLTLHKLGHRSNTNLNSNPNPNSNVNPKPSTAQTQLKLPPPRIQTPDLGSPFLSESGNWNSNRNSESCHPIGHSHLTTRTSTGTITHSPTAMDAAITANANVTATQQPSKTSVTPHPCPLADQPKPNSKSTLNANANANANLSLNPKPNPKPKPRPHPSGSGTPAGLAHPPVDSVTSSLHQLALSHSSAAYQAKPSLAQDEPAKLLDSASPSSAATAHSDVPLPAPGQLAKAKPDQPPAKQVDPPHQPASCLARSDPSLDPPEPDHHHPLHPRFPLESAHTHHPSQPAQPAPHEPSHQLFPPSSSPPPPDMTPAQKIAREVRRSFSLSKPPQPFQTPQPSQPSQPPQPPQLPILSLDSAPPRTSSPELLTPAQAVAHHTRQLDTLLDPPSNPTPAPSTPAPASKPSPIPPSQPNPEPVSFRVISGRKGLPGDGKDQTAVVRPVTENNSAPEKPLEPKIVKRISKLSLANPPTVSPSVTVDQQRPPAPPVEPSLPSHSLASSLAPCSVPSSTVPIPTTPIVSPPTPAAPPIIPLAVFPSYHDDDDDTGSIGFSDADPEKGEMAEETDEEEDYDSNPLYIVLSTSLSPRLKDAYDSAKLVLLPTRRALPLDMPRKLPDPTIEFESEWEQWIAAHTFVSASEAREAGPSAPGKKEFAKEGIEWVGIAAMSDRMVNLCLKPGTGMAEVRLTYTKTGATLGSPTSAVIAAKPVDCNVAAKDGPPSRLALDGDPHRTIRAKVAAQGARFSHSHHPPAVLHVTSTQPNPSASVAIDNTTATKTTTSTCSSLATNSDFIRSPSTATESSMALTQSSCGVSRTSSEGWSDMPPTPPNLSASISLQPRAGLCKSNLSSTLKRADAPVDEGVLAIDSQLAASLKGPLPTTTVTKIQTAKIISEETMYRSPPARPTGQLASSSRIQPNALTSDTSVGEGLESALSGSKAKKGKEVEQRLRFKAPKWLRPGAAQKEKEKEKERREKAAAVATARMREERDRELSLMTKTGPRLERVRLISLKGPVIECWWQQQGELEDEEEGHDEDAGQKHKVACEECQQGGDQGRAACAVPFPRARTRTMGSCAEQQRRGVNRSSASLSRQSTQSSSCPNQQQLMARRSSSINTVDDDRLSHQSGSRRESHKRRSRRMPSGLSVLRHGGSSKYRSLLIDLAFLLSPPEELGAIVCGILRKSVSKIWMNCHRFCDSVVFLKGFDNYILSQLKNEIFGPMDGQVREDLKRYGHETVSGWASEDWERISSLIENVLFAFLHSTLYSRGISCHYSTEDDYLDSILHNYRKRQIPLSEFEIELPAALQDENLLTDAVEKLNQLRAYEGAHLAPSPLSPEILQRLFVAMDTADEQMVLNVLMAKTPYECISIIKQTIDILVSVWNAVSTQAGMDEEARRLTPDDLLALLASVIVRSGVQQQHSLIHYAKVFRLGPSLSPEIDWAFVSYQAAIAYLQSDPFSAVDDSQSVRSQAVSISSMPNSPSLAAGWTRRRPASFTPPTTSSNAITISARSSPNGSRLSLTEHILPRNTHPYPSAVARAAPPPIQARHRSRGQFGARAHQPTSGLALVDPPLVRLEVTSAGHEHSRSVDCLRTCGEGVQRSASKLGATRPALTPISTSDRVSRHGIEMGMLSAPMIDGGCGRSCSNPWESIRSLSSIGEVVADGVGPPSTVPSGQTAPSASAELASVPSRTTRRPLSSCIEGLGFGRALTAEPATELAPVLSRRKTVDWAGTSVGRVGELAEDGSELLSAAGGMAFPSLCSSHSRSDSLADSGSDTGCGSGGASGGASGSELGMRRTLTASSSGHPGASQPTESWLEWGRKRLTSVTSLNLGGVAAQEALRPLGGTAGTRDGLAPRARTAGGVQHHRASSISVHMTPAMEALKRANQAGNQHGGTFAPSASVGHPGRTGSGGMVPLRTLRASTNLLLSSSVGHGTRRSSVAEEWFGGMTGGNGKSGGGQSEPIALRQQQMGQDEQCKVVSYSLGSGGGGMGGVEWEDRSSSSLVTLQPSPST